MIHYTIHHLLEDIWWRRTRLSLNTADKNVEAKIKMEGETSEVLTPNMIPVSPTESEEGT